MITPRDEDVLEKLGELMACVHIAKLGDKSQKDRCYAIINTDIEKIYAYFRIYILEE